MRFFKLLAKIATPENKLYILGDCFDQWIRDSIDLTTHHDTVDALANANKRGLEIFMQYGNRDFMLGKDFSQATGIRYIPDPCHIHIDNHNVTLMHGDTLCTDDVAYQRTRRVLQNPLSKWLFNNIPKAWVLRFTRRLRQTSTNYKQRKHNTIMDSNAQTVSKIMQHCDVLIHGHTHRPQTHQHDHGTRYVLGDWQHDCQVLLYQQKTFTLLSYRDAIKLFMA